VLILIIQVLDEIRNSYLTNKEKQTFERKQQEDVADCH
jgi:hypothetical protein